MKKNLIFCGDIHGDIREIVWIITEKYNIKDTSIIFVGDFGVGFGRPNSLEEIYKRVSKKLDKNNNTLYALRGNHDDPKYFDGSYDGYFPRLNFLVDHKLVEIDGWSIYPIGGASSVDKEWRLKENDKQKHFGSSLKVWWEGERPDMTVDEFPVKVDIIISHTSPSYFPPTNVRCEDESYETYKNIVEERNYLSQVLTKINAKYWFFGHFHQSLPGTFGKLFYRGLGIKELFELRSDEEK